jgi:hypothetical protein
MTAEGGADPWWREHTALLLTALVSLWTVLKVIVVSGGSQTVALAVLRETGTPTVLLGLLVVFAPSLTINLHTWCVAQVLSSGPVVRRVMSACGIVASGFIFLFLRASFLGRATILVLDSVLALGLVLPVWTSGRRWVKKFRRLNRTVSDQDATVAEMRRSLTDEPELDGVKQDISVIERQLADLRSNNDRAIARNQRALRSFLRTTDKSPSSKAGRLSAAVCSILVLSLTALRISTWREGGE